MNPYLGIIPGKTISGALAVLRTKFDHNWFVVIRCIDSTVDRSDLVAILNGHGITSEIICGNVCVTMGGLIEAVDTDVFSGFDEIWIFRRPPSIDLAELPPATSDAIDFSEQCHEEILRTVESESVAILLGDGCGLNFATCDPYFLEVLKSDA